MAYSNATIRRAEQILGYGIKSGTGEREYPVIDGVVYTDVFEGTATVDGVTFTPAFNGKRYGVEYYNELHVSGNCKRTVKVTAAWGSTKLMTELEDLLDWIEANPAVDGFDSAGSKSLRIKDYAETFGTAEEQTADLYEIIDRGWGYYVRKPLIISVGETGNAAGYF